MDVTTQELFLRLGSTSQSRSVRADALFRRLRAEAHEQAAEPLKAAPVRLNLKRTCKRTGKPELLLTNALP